MEKHRESAALKVALFATGCAGIVAEYVLSTLATYLIGNAIFQWTMVMSLMLFAMGVGSRISRFFTRHLLEVFILIEFGLSILCAMSAEVAYGLSPYTSYIGLVIYAQAFVIGVLIGLEIPIVTRLNDAYEELRTNISAIMEKDYYGALLGGLVFAFFALPHLGLTYTPIILGSINFSVAAFLLWRFFGLVRNRKTVMTAFVLSCVMLGTIGALARPIIQYGEQKKYKDKIIYARQTPYQKIVLTQWKSFYWLYINGQEQFSTFDEEKYHEPLVHPAMTFSPAPQHVLILGGGDGLALREVLQYEAVQSVTLVDIDPEMTELAATHEVFQKINNRSMQEPRLTVVNQDACKFLEITDRLYNVVIVDLPDPDSIDLMHVYSQTFYELIRTHLTKGGIMTVQATSPYFSKNAFLCILKTIRHCGFSAVPYHNQVPTMGEWGWVLAVKAGDLDETRLKESLGKLQFSHVATRFLNQDAMIAMIHFGKGILEPEYMEPIEINTQINPVLYRYYLKGSWGVY